MLLPESLHCRRRLFAENLGGFLLLFERLLPEGWSTRAGKSARAGKRARADKRPNGRSCRDETWIVYQGFNDCKLCATQGETTKIETERLGKNCSGRIFGILLECHFEMNKCDTGISSHSLQAQNLRIGQNKRMVFF